MVKYSFLNDYSEGAHPDVLHELISSNDEQERGYGSDGITAEVIERLRTVLRNPAAGIHLVAGGTQANLIVLASMLRPHEAVIAAETAHVNLHEAGAIESTGHKILAVASGDGKLDSRRIASVLEAHTDEHMVKPRAVFISNATELGTIYTKKELEALSSCCRDNALLLYLDGARLGAALAADESDLRLPDLAGLVDVFYIGGTKNGALLGEAIVVNDPALDQDFRFHIKQRGGLLAKSRVLSAQFRALFSEDLWFRLARSANETARAMSQGLCALGVSFLTPSCTNQIFPIFENRALAPLRELYAFYDWKRIDAERTAIRLVTSWATPRAAIDGFLSDAERCLAG